jgi:hypothetical protein
MEASDKTETAPMSRIKTLNIEIRDRRIVGLDIKNSPLAGAAGS